MKKMIYAEFMKTFISNWLRSGWVWGKMVKGLGLGGWKRLSNIHMYVQHPNPDPKTIWCRLLVSKRVSVSSVENRNRVSTNVSPFEAEGRTSMKSIIDFQVSWA